MAKECAGPATGPVGPLARGTPMERLGGLLALGAVELLYFPINRLAQGGMSTRWPALDDLIPLWPAWVVPYLLSVVWWNGCFVWAAWKMGEANWRALVRGAIVVMLSSYLVYLVWPTYVVRQPVPGDGWAAELLRAVYAHDRTYNALPSGHTYSAVLIALFWSHWLPRWRWLWIGSAAVVILSTLFTGQHHLLDPLGGALVGYLGYRFGLWAAAWKPGRMSDA